MAYLAGSWHHVLNRPLEKRWVFPDEKANQHFLELLGILPPRFGLEFISTYRWNFAGMRSELGEAGGASLIPQ